MRPGITNAPLRSVTTDRAGLFNCAADPTQLMRPSTITIAESGCEARPVPSISVKWSKTLVSARADAVDETEKRSAAHKALEAFFTSILDDPSCPGGIEYSA